MIQRGQSYTQRGMEIARRGKKSIQAIQNKVGKYCKSIYFLLAYVFLLFLFLSYALGSDGRSPEISSRQFLTQTKPIANSAKTRMIMIFMDSQEYKDAIKMPIVEKILQDSPDNSIFFKVNSTWPTLTDTKIMAMMTGCDIKTPMTLLKDFYLSSYQLDHLMKKYKSKGLNATSIGANLWSTIGRVPQLKRCPQENSVSDFFSCDQLAYQESTEMLKNMNDSLIVFHLSSLDRIKHQMATVNTPILDEQQKKYSKFTEKVISQIQQNDILILLGDHGSSIYGSHGYTGLDQRSAFTLIYSKGQKIIPLLDKGSQLLHVDLTPTLALLYNLSIPKNSIGVPIFIPQKLINSYGNNLNEQQLKKSIIKTTVQQFEDVIDFSGAFCPSLQNMSDEDKNSLTFQQLKQIQLQCLQPLSQVKANTNFLLILIFLMKVSVYLGMIAVGISLPYALLIIPIVSYPFVASWESQLRLGNYMLYNVLFVNLLLGKGKPLNKLGFVAIIVFLSQYQIYGYKNFFYSSASYIRNIVIHSPFLIISLVVGSITTYCVMIWYNRSHPGKKISKFISFVLIPIVIVAELVKIILDERQIGTKNYSRRNHIIVFNYLITIVLLTFLGLKIFKWFKNERQSVGFFSNINKIDLMISLLSFLSIFNNQHYWIIVVSYIIITQVLLDIEGRFKGLVAYSFGIFAWTIFGHSYSYSIFNNGQKYVFTTKIVWFTPICVFLYVSSAFFIPIICELIEKQQPKLEANKIQENTETNINQSSQIQVLDSTEVSANNDKPEKVKFQDFLTQFLLIPMGLLIPTSSNLLWHTKGSIALLSTYCKIFLMQGTKILLITTCIVFIKVYKKLNNQQ